MLYFRRKLPHLLLMIQTTKAEDKYSLLTDTLCNHLPCHRSRVKFLVLVVTSILKVHTPTRQSQTNPNKKNLAEDRTAILNTDGVSLHTFYYRLLQTKLKNYFALLKFCHVFR